MYCIHINKVLKELKDDIEIIKKEIEEYFKKNYGEDIKLNYEIIEENGSNFFAYTSDDTKIRFNIGFINDVYACLFNKISDITPNDTKILEDVIKILLNSILVHESHHFYYRNYRPEEHAEIKNEDNKKEFRKDMVLEILADDFMMDFMKEKGVLHYMISGLSEKFNQMKNDDYTKDDRIDDIVKEIKNIYKLN